jgi:hypothetical protein
MSLGRLWSGLTLALACGALAACAHQPPSAVKLLSQHDEAGALERIRSSTGPPADDPGWAATLNSAAFQGSVPVMRELLARGADPNAERNGARPLHFATSKSTARINEDGVRFLLDAKADPRLLDSARSSSPLQTLANRPARSDMDVKLRVMQLLVERGSDVTHQDNLGWTALHYSALWGDSDAILALLLDHGADPAVGSTVGLTPIDLAIRGDYESTARFLFERGGKPRVLVADDLPQEAHWRAKISGKEFALYGDWQLRRNDVAGARAAYETAKQQLTQATADLAAVDRDACVTALHEVEAKLAALPAPAP